MSHKKYTTYESKKNALLANNRKYFKTKKGKMVSTYVNMNRRVRGYVKSHLYEGLELMRKEEFYAFTESSAEYDVLYSVWVASGYSRRLSPSIDRIDTNKGYVMGNIQWITHSENSRKGSLSRRRKTEESVTTTINELMEL
jgi:hypothetical protein